MPNLPGLQLTALYGAAKDTFQVLISPGPMTTFHVMAAAGGSAHDLRSLGLCEWLRQPARRSLAASPQLYQDPVTGPALRDPDVVQLLRREQQQIRDALAEPDVSFIVTPVEAEAHFVRDHDGEVRSAAEVERRRAWMRRDFGVDVL